MNPGISATLAKFMKENNLCLEEFVELAKAQQEQEALKEAEME